MRLWNWNNALKKRIKFKTVFLLKGNEKFLHFSMVADNRNQQNIHLKANFVVKRIKLIFLKQLKDSKQKNNCIQKH